MLDNYESFYEELKELGVIEGQEEPEMYYTGMCYAKMLKVTPDIQLEEWKLIFYPHATEVDKSKIGEIFLKHYLPIRKLFYTEAAE